MGGDFLAYVTPHFDIPFTLGACQEQGTVADLANCIFAIVVTPEGWREEVPWFGIPDLAFDNPPVMRNDIMTSIGTQEPRAELAFKEGPGINELEKVVNIAIEARTGVS